LRQYDHSRAESAVTSAQINPFGLIVMHDASSHLKTVRDAASKLEQEGLISVVLLPTPRGHGGGAEAGRAALAL